MNEKVKNTLKSWKTSIEKHNKLDAWNFREQITSLGRYLRSNEDSKEIVRIVHYIRDYAISKDPKTKQILKAIDKVLDMVEPTTAFCIEPSKIKGRIKKNGQEVRFKCETKHLFEERLQFKNNMLLRNFDIETESAKDARKVRRIVEKRMCQAYHRMNKRVKGEKVSNRAERYWMSRATSFQLYNIGQIENVERVSRGYSTHWKRTYDVQTNQKVFKKKMTYSSEEEVLKAVDDWTQFHPNDNREVTAYKCAVCGKWHIGHKSEAFEFENLSDLVSNVG